MFPRLCSSAHLRKTEGMSREFFGTDGIRGRANEPPMTAEMALKVAMATAKVLRTRREGSPTDRVVIGKDTRVFCLWG